MMMSARRNLELMERVSFERKLDWDSDDSDDLFNDEGGGGIRNGGFALPPPFKGKHQLPAMLRRQWLFKKRGWGQTLMELISPLLMMSLVVWGWSRSTEDHFDMEFPVNSTIPVFKAVKNEFGTAQSLLHLCSPDKLLAQNVSPEELALIATLIREGILQGLDGLQALNSTRNMTLSDALINGELLIGGVPMSPVLISLAMKCVGSASQLATAFHAFDEYHGPLPVPSLDAFVGLGKLLRQALAGSDQPDEMLRFQSMFSWLLGNLLTHGRITFAPNSTEVSGLVNHLLSETELFKEVYGGTFASEKDAVNSALINTENDKPIWAIVVVNKLDPIGGHVDYKIRMNFTTVPRTMRIVHRRRIGLLTYYKHYYTSGFLSLQDAVNSYVFKLAPKTAGADTLSEKLMWGAPFPVPPHSRNKFYRSVGPMLGLVMCLTTLYPLGMLVKALVEEKETRVKETMFIMGLKSWVFSLSWATTYLAVFLLISLSVTLLLAVTVFPRSDASLLLLLFFLFTTSLISFGFFLSVFFSKAKLAAIVAPFVYFGSIMPRYIFFRASDGQAIPGKSIAALLPPTAFTFGADLVAHYEGAMLGITWANIFEDEFSMAWILGLLLIDTFLYAVLAWYLEQVLPSEYGSRQPLWFLLSPNWWRGSHSAAEAKYQKLSTNMDEGGDGGSAHNEPYNAADGRQPAVKIRDLKKLYPGGKVAVENLTLEVYEGHITALMGHNGAGKSTTISILTGLIRPTGGDAHIWGHSIRDNMNDVRRTIGVCPQQNVLFSYLTVKEHLELFAALKGVPKLDIDQQVQDMVTRLGLSEKMNTPVSCLSGGMKRKLQIGLAMIGKSRVVFLDEPTSGLDPQSRRGVWELLRKFKTGRAIILTTHYMDEADLLCDRIAIMSEGRLKCSGSSLFLKAKFGVGYNLSMTRSSAACNDTALTALVHKHIPQAILLSSAGGELAFQLPLSNKDAFAQLFLELEQQKEELHIGGYGVSMTTLEEVFLRLASDSVTADECEAAHFVKNPVAVSHRLENENLVGKSLQETSIGEEAHLNKRDVVIPISSRRCTARSLQNSFARVYGQMFLKRFLIARRDWKGLANSVLLPVLAISLVMLILKLNIDPAGPSLQLDFRIFKPAGQRSIIPVIKASHNEMSTLRANDYVKFQAQDSMNNSVAMSEELLHTYWSAPTRFGALVFNDTLWPKLNTSSLRKLNMTQVGGLFNISSYGSRGNPNTSTLNETYSELFQSPTGQGIFSPVTYLFNTTSDHALPALIQELMQARLKANLGNESAILKVASHPLPLSKTEFMELQTVLAVLAALFVLIPFCYLGASYAVFVVRERAVKAKLLQMVSGASCVAYWSATYTWDLITYAATLSITMVVFELYRDKSFIGSWAKTGATLSVLMSFGASVIPLTYCYSFGFSNHANAQVAISGIHFATGFGMLVGSLVMGDVEETKALNEKLVHVYHLFPPYNLGRSLVQLSALDFRSQILGKSTDPFKWDILGRPLTYMIAEIFGYLLLTILIDNGTLLRAGGFIWAYISPASLESRQSVSFSDTTPLKEDVDVSNERKRVEGGHACSASVIVHGLRKVYPSGRGLEPMKVAVRDLSLGIPRGECFGFLGVNGAGKSTTLSILSGDIKPTSGEVYINGHSVLKNLPAAQKQIGYCPQFDPLLDLMTGREHLHMYAILKGVPKEDVTEVVNTLVQAVGLQKYVDRVAGTYSGGNKRKLALAIALVGNPAVVFLDEPSSGMDPVARRSMWNLITNAILERDMSVVLTTHSMEECEALCSRVGVMVSGSLVCLGSIQHIKSRFDSGYTVEMRLARANSLETLHQFMSLTFPTSWLDEEHLTRVKYSIPVKDVTLSELFSALEKEKERLGLEDYSVCQSTLEQVFLRLASGKPEEIEC